MERQDVTMDEAFNLICKSPYLGNLGLFVGTGFVLSVLKDHQDYTGYSWKELLIRVCEELAVDYDVTIQI
jgi:hypothetical protein